jgi:hypothetical protein
MTRADVVNQLAALSRRLSTTERVVIDEDGHVISRDVTLHARGGGESFVLNIRIVRQIVSPRSDPKEGDHHAD